MIESAIVFMFMENCFWNAVNMLGTKFSYLNQIDRGQLKICVLDFQPQIILEDYLFRYIALIKQNVSLGYT